VGRTVTEHRGALLLSHPVAHGCVRDWAELELLWRAALEEVRGGGGGKGGKGGGEASPLLLATPAQAPRAAREDAAQRAFEALGVPAVHFAPSATLALYATGRTTGLVLECGEGVSAATPVYEGFGLPHAGVRCDYGGGEVTALLAALLRRAGVAFSTAAERDAVRELKEAAAYVAPEPGAAEAGAAGAPPTSHTLPDGTRLALGAELFRAPEVLFNPALAGLEAPGLGAAALAAVARCDMDLRRPLLGAVVLAGGGTALRGLPARVLGEVRRGAPADARVRVWAPADRKLLTWLGGSILGSLSTFRGMLVTKEEWDEEGPEALHRRGAL
jgi:centractin